MTRPFWQTLAWRLTLAFALVSALSLSVVGFISVASTRAQFSALLGAQARETLQAQVEAYVQQRGAVAGFRPVDTGPPRPAGDGRGQGAAQQGEVHSPWLVLDADRRAVYATPDAAAGAVVRRAGELPVAVAGRTVAYIVPSSWQARPDRRGQDFLNRTLRAIAWAMLGATLLAALMGVLVSRALLRPLTDLLGRIHALQKGEQVEPTRARTDEIGEVLGAFDAMHQSVLNSQRAHRQLTADIAHDLNTPLSVIAGTLEGMIDGTFRPTPERFRRLHGETLHVTQLVGDLRFLSMADAGELQIHRRPTDVVTLVSDVVTSVHELAGQRGVTLQAELPAAGHAALDPVRITQVLHNLLSNALAHTPAGGQVCVAARQDDQTLVLSVQDSGVGIALEHVERVFDRLYRVDSSRSGGGSGLGLSICRKVVEAHGGAIALESVPGRGTTVTVRLPNPGQPA